MAVTIDRSAAFLLAASLLTGCGAQPPPKTIKSLLSPDGKKNALIIVDAAGTLSYPYVWISIVDANRTTSSPEERVIVTKECQNVSIQWSGDKTLNVFADQINLDQYYQFSETRLNGVKTNVILREFSKLENFNGTNMMNIEHCYRILGGSGENERYSKNKKMHDLDLRLAIPD